MTRANIPKAKRERTVHGGGAPRSTEEEREFIRKNFGKMSQAAMARELNRSTGLVSKLVKQMGLTEAKASAQPEEIPEPEPDDGSALSRLKRLQGIVWRNILGCDPRNLAQLSKEYRALTQEIENLERAGGGGDYGESAAVDTLLEAIGRKLSS